MQRSILAQALGLLATAEAPRKTVTAPFTWKDVPGWRQRYNYVGPENREELAARGEARRKQQAAAKNG